MTTKYDKIYDQICVAVESGDLDVDDAEEINKIAFERFGDDVLDDDDDVDFTLEDAMEYVEEELSDSVEFTESVSDMDTVDKIGALAQGVVVAFESGSITEEKAEGLLNLLNVDNYEIDEEEE